MSESVHEISLRLAQEWLNNISDEQFLKEYNAITKKNNLLKKAGFKNTSFFNSMTSEYLEFGGDFPLLILEDLNGFLAHLKAASPSTRTHYQGLDEYSDYKYSFIRNILDKYGFVNGEKELNEKNKPVKFFFSIYAKLESFAGSPLFVLSDGASASKSSARDRNNWLIKELEQLIRFIEMDIMPALAINSMNISKFLFELDDTSLRKTVVANTNGSTMLRASVSVYEKNMLIEAYFLNKPLVMSMEKGVFIQSLNESAFEKESLLLDDSYIHDIDFISNSIASGEHSLYEMFGYNQSCFFKFSDHEKIRLKERCVKKAPCEPSP